MTATALAMAAIPVAALAWLYRRDQQRTAAHRHRAFENCRGVLDGAELTQDRGDYPVLTGTRGGHAVELSLLADNINVRKLPVLWLKLSVRRPLPVGGVLDVMLRPKGTEYFSPADRLPDWLPTPSGWPEQAVLRGRGRAEMAGIAARLDPHLRALGDDGRFKELLVGPGGARLVWMVDEAERSQYLAMRQASFRNDILERAMVERLIGRLVALCGDLSETTQ